MLVFNTFGYRFSSFLDELSRKIGVFGCVLNAVLWSFVEQSYVLGKNRARPKPIGKNWEILKKNGEQWETGVIQKCKKA